MVMGPVAEAIVELIAEMLVPGEKVTTEPGPGGKAISQLHCAFELSVIAMIKKIIKKMINRIFLVFILLVGLV